MNRKIIVVLAVIVGILSFSSFAVSQIERKLKDDLYSQIELYSYVLATVQADYVDKKDPKELIYSSLKGMVGSLDPHSQFLTPEEYKELKTETEGKFGGLGIEISIRDGLLTVISPIEGTPAWKAGVKAGDRIVKIENKLTRDMSLSDAVKKLRGKPGTDVTITILRESEFKIFDLTIKRAIINIPDVKNTQILEDHIGYIRLTEFREDSAIEFRKALDKLKKEGADSLILDLRNNPGGLLKVAIKITEEFLPEGTLIVSTKGRHPSQDIKTYSKNKDHVITWPMVVLVNEGSASGSEILAGALKDNKRAIILGTQTFGKGSVQSVIPLPDGSGLRLTTSKYFTPSGKSIHGKGITPDIIVKYVPPPKKEKNEKEKKVEEIFDNIEMREAKNPEKLKASKQEKEEHDKLMRDNQILAAINVLKGVKVFSSFEKNGKSDIK